MAAKTAASALLRRARSGEAATVADALGAVADRLRAAGVSEPRRDARLLVAHALQVAPEWCLTYPETQLSGGELAAIDALAARRARREPVARILGAREFWGRTFKVTPAVLDPRPDSETLIEAALAIAAQEGWRERPIRILDIGTGSGALLLTLLCELPLATGLGTDICSDALAVARSNAHLMGVIKRAEWAQASLLSNVSGRFNLVVSNPPYIATDDIKRLEPEVRDHDPSLALDGGLDGLDAYRGIAVRVGRIAPGGWLLLEIGAGQEEQVVSTLVAAGVVLRRSAVQRHEDLAGKTRVLGARIVA
jgi:release factor glutamine methyltransferase